MRIATEANFAVSV